MLHTPTGAGRVVKKGIYARLALVLPDFTRRHRKALVFARAPWQPRRRGRAVWFPGLLQPMSVGTDNITYLDP